MADFKYELGQYVYTLRGDKVRIFARAYVEEMGINPFPIYWVSNGINTWRLIEPEIETEPRDPWRAIEVTKEQAMKQDSGGTGY